MLKDLNTPDSEIFSGQFDYCVCGTGPAGITIARKLAAGGASVLLLEAGGFNYSAESLQLYAGGSIGSTPYYGTQSCRLRYFGGTSNHWAGRCGILDPIDFTRDDIFDMPGWPISHAETYTHLEEAREIVDISDQPFSRFTPPEFDTSRYRVGIAAYSTPTRFGQKYREEITAADNIRLVINANVTDLTLSDDGQRVQSVKVQSYSGEPYTVTAGEFVIAFGALENARFLLNARSQVSAGIGNHSDYVGRTFMEHFNVGFGRFIDTGGSNFWTNQRLWPKGRYDMAPSDELMQSRGIGNSVVTLNPSGAPRFFGRLAPLRELRNKMTCSTPTLRNLAEGAGAEVICAGDGLVGTLMEQVPNRNSRIVLNESSQDRFGNSMLDVQWELHDQDWKTIAGLAEALGKTFASQDIARLKVFDSVYDRTLDIGQHCHHMGTTRMSADPRDGVVDPDCKVHNIDNLYIGGSSVFSTGGGTNPTFTIVCLALRLADHLLEKRGQPA